MKRGEERWAAIHPSYAYGDHSFFPPNATLLVKIQLLDFQEGDQDLTPSPPHPLAAKSIAEMQTRFDTLKAQKYYEKGRHLWNVIKQNGDPIDLQLVKKAIDGVLTDERDCPFKTVEEAHTYSIRFRDYLLSNTHPSREKRFLASP